MVSQPPARPHRRQLMTLSAAAELLACNEKTLRRYISAGDLRGYRIGPRSLRVELAEVEALARPIPTAGVF